MSADNWCRCPRCERDKDCFREDYSVSGAEDGVVEVRYRGFCRMCRLEVEFTHRHIIRGLGD